MQWIVFVAIGVSQGMGVESRADTPVDWTHLSSADGDLEPPNDSGSEQVSMLVLDVNKDGINDFVTVERSTAPSVVWYRSDGSGWTKHVVDATRQKIEAGGTYHDIDNDGDLDLVFGGDPASNQVWWWENPFPNYAQNVSWTRRLIKDSGATKQHDLLFADVDGDNKDELVSWNQNAKALLLFEVPADPRNHNGEWPSTTIYEYPDTGFSWEGMAVADIDLDGKLDILGAARWFKNTHGTTYVPQVIDGGRKREWTRIAAGQLVKGGRPEPVISSGDSGGPLTWYSWNGNGWDHHVLVNFVDHGHSLDIEDVDGDGNLDIFVAEMGEPGAGADCRMWVFYGDGAGSFTQQLVDTGIANHESKLGDINGDGTIDIVGKPYKYNAPRVDIWLNDSDGTPPPPPPPPPTDGLDAWTYIQVDDDRERWGDFDDPAWLAYFGLGFGDIDNNDALDIVSGRYVYRNPGGDMTSNWQRIDVGFNVDCSLVADVDGDVYADIIGTRGSSIYWIEADNSNGTSWTERLIDSNAPASSHLNPQGYAIADIARGGKPEIVLSNDRTVYYYQIPDSNPEAGNWPRVQILSQSNSEGVGIADIDGDGYLDVAVPHVGGSMAEMKWARNPRDGSADWQTFIIGQTSDRDLDRVAAADLNGDGRVDIVCSEENTLMPATTYWFEAPANPTSVPWTRHEIVTQNTTNSMDIADMDGDGDVDVVLQEHRGSKKLSIWENDSDGNFTEHVIDTGKEGHLGARVFDLDGDGACEIVSIAFDDYRKLHLWRNDNAVGDGGGDPPSTITCYDDDDSDGYGDAESVHVVTGDTCSAGDVTNDGDCNDQDGEVHPGADEIPGDGIDNDCVGGDDTGTGGGVGRVTSGLVVLYTFAEGSGNVVHDVSDNAVPIDLSISSEAAVSWMSGGGLRINSPAVIAATTTPTKLCDAIKGSNAITVEAWVASDNINQNGPARIVSFSKNTVRRNMTLGQDKDCYDVRLRTTATSSNGTPSTASPSGSLAETLQHVVYTRNSGGNASIYIDGQLVTTASVQGDCSSWDDGHGFVLANEFTGDRPWLGELYLIALFDRALSNAEVQQNFDAGPDGESEPGEPQPPSITRHPQDQSVVEGDSATFTVVVIGSDLSYQWQMSVAGTWSNIVSATQTTHTILSATLLLDGAQLRCAVSNPEGRTFSESATLFVVEELPSPPTVTSQPRDMTVSEGEPAVFVVRASGDQLTYQWQVWTGSKWMDAAGMTQSGYAIATTMLDDDGLTVRCGVSNPGGEVYSDAATLTVIDPADRATDGQLVLYLFNESNGNVVHDVSGVGQPLDLTMADQSAVSWLSGGGLRVNSPTLIVSSGVDSKLNNAIKASDEITIEAWVTPANTTQLGPARIVTLSDGASSRNFTLGQGQSRGSGSLYDVRLRTTATSSNGLPSMATSRGSLTTDKTHVVYTRDAAGNARIYLDGVLATSGMVGGDCSSWTDNHRLGLANEITSGRPWLGEYYLVAIFDRAITAAEVDQNYQTMIDP